MKQLLAAALVFLFSMVLMADMVKEKEKTENMKPKKHVYAFASRECKGIGFKTGDRCLANYCTQADAVEVYLIISKKDYRNAVSCFKTVFEPCATSCSAGSANTVSAKCNALLNRCIHSK